LGLVIWITGLPGAGKTTLGRRLLTDWRDVESRTVLLDGDEMRDAFGREVGYTKEERRSLAFSYSRLCKMLANQGCEVICTTVSMFHEIREWNQQNLSRYVEIYIRSDPAILATHNRGALYNGAPSEEFWDVAGGDIPFEEPRNPDVIVQNDGTQSIDDLYSQMLSGLTNSLDL
jgi:adenylylsulfate kinase